MEAQHEPLTMETINGWTVIAERDNPWVRNERIILAVRRDKYSPSQYEYVTAHCLPRSDQPRSWFWGHYTFDLADALASLDERSK